MLRRTVSRDPTDRLDMSAMTSFLRTLAEKTTARLGKIATLQPVISDGLPPMTGGDGGGPPAVIAGDLLSTIGRQQVDERPVVGRHNAGPAAIGLAQVPVIAGGMGGGRGGRSGRSDVRVPRRAVIVHPKTATPIAPGPVAGGFCVGPVLMSPQDILDGAAAAAPVRAPVPTPNAIPDPADVGFAKEIGGGGNEVVVLMVDDNIRRRKAPRIVPASWSPATGLVGFGGGCGSGGDGCDTPKGVTEEGPPSAFSLHLPPMENLAERARGDDDAHQRTPSSGDTVEWAWLTPCTVVAPNAAQGGRDTDGASSPTPAVPPVEADEAGRDRAPPSSAAEQRPPAREGDTNVAMPSLEEIAGWVDLPPLPFPGSAAEALANRLDSAVAEAEAIVEVATAAVAAAAATMTAAVVTTAAAMAAASTMTAAAATSLGRSGVRAAGDDLLVPLLLPGVVYPPLEVNGILDGTMHAKGDISGLGITLPVAAKPLAGKQAYPGGSCGGGGGGDGSGGGGRSSGMCSQRQQINGGCTQEREGKEWEAEVAVGIGGGPNAQLTASEVLARGFATSTPASDAPTHPPPPPAPRLRPRRCPRPRRYPRPRSPPGFPGSPRACGHHPNYVCVGGTMPPVLLLTPSAIPEGDGAEPGGESLRRGLGWKQGGGEC